MCADRSTYTITFPSLTFFSLTFLHFLAQGSGVQCRSAVQCSAVQCMERIEKSCVRSEYKLWMYQHYLLPSKKIFIDSPHTHCYTPEAPGHLYRQVCKKVGRSAFMCNQCPYTLERRNGLPEHIKSVHGSTYSQSHQDSSPG